MNKKWNLQDIRPAATTRKRTVAPVERPVSTTVEEVIETEPATQTRPRPIERPLPYTLEHNRYSNSMRRWLYLGGAFLAVVVIVAIGTSLGKTEVTVYPKFREPNVDSDFTVQKENSDNGLTYEIMTLEEVGDKQVPATGQEHVEEQATGTIEITKTTPGNERLIKNTRFRTKEGLIFRVQESVQVTGGSGDAPGRTTAKVFADEVGDKYNVPAGTTFDVPGFQENGMGALYGAITAQATSQFTGGFSGTQFKIAENDLNSARQTMQNDLRGKLLARIEAEKPAGFVAFPAAATITFDRLPEEDLGSGMVKVRERATLQIPLFKSGDLASFLAKQTIATYESEPVRMENIESLQFAYTDQSISTRKLTDEASLTFHLNGKPRIIWECDQKALAEDLAGLPKTAINNVVGAYSCIESVRVSMTPFWQRSFPDEAEDVIITEKVEDPKEITN